MNLNNLFIEFFTRHFGSAPARNYLLAVSGGIDSMAMLDLFYKAGMSIGVAHCNFSLRGTESDKDHELVKRYCLERHIDFYEQRFDTGTVAAEQKISIQMAARELRYSWFNELAASYSYNFIATAHHQDDNAETILMNIIRGTGIQGLSGIPLINRNIIRPLLFASKEQLRSYVEAHNIPYREDSSNKENKYARNKIRNEIIPALQEINAETVSHLNALGAYARTAGLLLGKQVQELREKYVSVINGQVHIDLKQIITHEHASFFAFELLKEYGFNAAQVTDMLTSFSRQNTGKSFYSNTYHLIIDRDAVILSELIPADLHDIMIPAATNQEIKAGRQAYALEYIEAGSINSFQKDHIYIDLDSISFPFIIRRWKKGDRFNPMGLKGMKKVSDFLIDEKINLLDKENVYVLESDGSIAAVLKHRTSENFKLTPLSRQALHIYPI